MTGNPTCPTCRQPFVETEIDNPITQTKMRVKVPSCDCIDKEEQRRAELERRNEIKKRLAESGIPRRYRQLVIDRKLKVEEIAAGARFMAEQKHYPGLVLWGKPGTGKTVSGCFILQKWTEAGARRARYIHLPTISTKKDRYAIVEALTKADVVHVDDMGYQKTDDKTPAFVFALVDALYREQVPTIYTTSKTREEVFDSLGSEETAKAVLDRLDEYPTQKLETKKSMRGESK